MNTNVQLIKEKYMRQLKWCNECHKKSIFQQHGTAWCSTVTFMGGMNQYGHCAKKGIDSPELIKYESTFKGEK